MSNHLKPYHWKKGQSGNPSGRPKKEKPKPPMSLAEMRKALTHRLPELIDQIYEQAMAGDGQAQKLIMDKVMPSLKAVHIETGASDLPMLMLNVTPQEVETLQRVSPASGVVIDGGGASQADADGEGHPAFPD